MPHRLPPRSLHLLPALLLLVFLLPLAGAYTDDGFIHLQYARNLIERGEYSFNPGEVSFGTSSPLWVLLIAAIGGLAGGAESLLPISRALAWISAFAALAVFHSLARALRMRPTSALLATCTLAADVWFARWTALSMESASAVLALLLVVLGSVHAAGDRRRAVQVGALVAIATLLRPELALALPVLLLAAATRRDVATLRCAAISAATACLALLPWLIFAATQFATLVPSTAAAKSSGLAPNATALLHALTTIAKTVASSQGAAVLALLAACALPQTRARLGAGESRFVVLWIVALPTAYLALGTTIVSRYLLLVTPLVCLLGWVSIEELVDRHLPRGWRGAAPIAIATVSVTSAALFYTRIVVPPSRAFAEDLGGGLRELALELDRRAAPDAVVAAADIGYLAYFGKRRVLDLGGLIEPATERLRAAIDYQELLDRALYLDLSGYPRVDYFVDRDPVRMRFDGRIISGRRFDALQTRAVRCLGIRQPGPYYFTLYELSPADSP